MQAPVEVVEPGATRALLRRCIFSCMAESMARLAEALRARYTIERELGAGGMATVYLARDLKHDRQVAVNRYLWQASLDVLSFLPIEAADPFSGLLVTGWGNVSGSGAYRVTVYISDPSLDARALKVAAFRSAGGGRAVPVGEAENRALEDAILTRARQLRIAEAGEQR